MIFQSDNYNRILFCSNCSENKKVNRMRKSYFKMRLGSKFDFSTNLKTKYIKKSSKQNNVGFYVV